MEQMEGVVLCTQARERESPPAKKITSVRGAKRVARMTHGKTTKQFLSKMSKGQLIQFVKEIQKTCNQTQDMVCKMSANMLGDEQMFESFKEEVKQSHIIIVENQECLHGKLLDLEKQQQEVMDFLQNFRGEVLARQNSNGLEDIVAGLRSAGNKLMAIANVGISDLRNFHAEILGRQDLNGLEDIVAELRSASNKLGAIAKMQHIGISELRSSTNKLNAMITYRWPKTSGVESSIVSSGDKGKS